MKNLKKEVKKMWRANPKQADQFFAIIGKGDGWYSPASPAGRIELIGFFNGMGELVPDDDQLTNMYRKELRACGEFADQLGCEGQLDYIALGKK